MNHNLKNFIRYAFPIAGLLMALAGLNCVYGAGWHWGFLLLGGVLILCTVYYTEFNHKK